MNSPNDSAAAAFIARWAGAQATAATELATSQSFIAELCDLLGVPKPHPTADQSYQFERPVTFTHADGSTSAGRIDCYRRGCFILEAKKLRHTAPAKFDAALLRARAQAEGYARALPAAEGRPPFLLVVDVGNVIEVHAEFSQSGGTYTHFPDTASHRIKLADLALPAVRERLRAIWLEPLSLDPARITAKVTREVAAELAQVAKSLESDGHTSDAVGQFLTRCLFTMFAEDVGLLGSKPNGLATAPTGPGTVPATQPAQSFLHLLQTWREQPGTLGQMLRVLWAGMDAGGFNAALAQDVRRFNGKLFKGASASGYVLPLKPEQIDGLIRAAQANWRDVEPAIFGTLLERVLSPDERHSLGAHYTPRAYVERLVMPTVLAPLRAEWANADAAALVLAAEGKGADAVATVRAFHHRLCTLRVLDPACGSGNFLYVTLEHLKRLEGEVLDRLAQLGEGQSKLGLEGETVTLQQLRGIELNERAAAVAEVVLWIGWLQWQIRTSGDKSVAEPVVHDYGNIECRDAVLAYDRVDLATDAEGQPLMRWDGKTKKPHPTTGLLVPDEAAMVPQWRYVRPRKAAWPKADFVVGNPPFIGAATVRAALGDGYAEALRQAWPEVPESADFVMHWWQHAAALTAAGQLQRFGLITTNSLRQVFNRRVVQAALSPQLAPQPTAPPVKKGKAAAAAPPAPLALAFAIADHPWVDNADGAAVRIAMTVVEPSATPATASGCLQTVVAEAPGEHGEVLVTLAERWGPINADLSVGANVASAVALQANAGLSNRGVQLFGAGFIVTPEQAQGLGLGAVPGLEQHIRPYRNGRDLTDKPRGVLVIDAFGLSAEQLRSTYPAVYQWLRERVKPERDLNNRASYRDNWWVHGEPRRELRTALAGLPRYIATVETAKHRTFQFLDASVLPDNKLIAIALDDAFHLGVLSSTVHVEWALAAGSTLEDRPVYVKTTCFETFPFPAEAPANPSLTPALRERIAQLAEQIDAHRKARLAAHPTLTLTGLYNLLATLRSQRAAAAAPGMAHPPQAAPVLTAKEQAVFDQGLVGVLDELHTELDAAVLQAYGWADLGTPTWAAGGLRAAEAWGQAVLARLSALNAERAALEAKAKAGDPTGVVHWLRPAFQAAGNTNPNAEQPVSNQPVFIGLQAEMPLEGASNKASSKKANAAHPPATEAGATTAPQPWPATLPEQVQAVAQALASGAAGGITLAELEARFKGRGPWKRGLPRILDTLAALGRARCIAAAASDTTDTTRSERWAAK